MSGKTYNGEKAIISLTSWKARIGTVSKTIFSLLKQCPGFHIVLVLSEEEFPKKEEELPENLMLFVNNGLIEILWVYKNYKSFKKVLFTMDKYRDVPVISADDDCVYLKNYAETLYRSYKNTRMTGVYYISHTSGTGYGALFSPHIFDFEKVEKYLVNEILKTNNDDVFYVYLIKKNEFGRFYLSLDENDFVRFHDSVEPLYDVIKKNGENEKAHKICKKIILQS